MAFTTDPMYVVKAYTPGRIASGLFGVFQDYGDIDALDTIISAFG